MKSSFIFAPAVKLMQRLRLPKKLMLLAAIFLIPMFVLAAAIVMERMEIVDFTKQERSGVVFIKSMRPLVSDVSHVRGLTNAYLNGNEKVKSQLQTKMNDVQVHYKNLLELEKKVTVSYTISPATELVKEWETISRSALKQSASESFAAYNKHLVHLADYIVHIADQSNLILDPELDSYYLMDLVVIQMPNMLDALGKMRGMGAGIAAAGKFTPETYTTISSYIEKAHFLGNKVEVAINKIYAENTDVKATLDKDVLRFMQAWQALIKLTNKKMIQSDNIQITSSEYLKLATETINEGLQLYDNALPQLDELLASRLNEKYLHIAETVAGMVIALFLMGYLFAGFYSSLMASIGEINRVVNKLSDGDLTDSANISSKDEIRVIGDNMNEMIEKINALISQVISAANQVSNGAQQTEATSNQSHEGINRQNSEIEQVATAINEMSATVQEVAKNASNAAEQTQMATNETGSGKQVVNQAMDAINNLSQEMGNATDVIKELETDSDNIGTVLDVIRGIAEQTNLLALNAAIEAARAGEQGRGFAVVADEVRTLASRTQTSTEEIQQMITKLQQGAQNAVQVMEQGNEQTNKSVQLAAEAGAALEAIASAVTQINDMNAQIASAAEEQSSVSAEIDRNVINIRDIASETVQGAHDTAASSQTMNQVAGQLMSLVKEFKV